MNTTIRKRPNLTLWFKYFILTMVSLTLISCIQSMSEQQMLDKARTYLDQGELQAAAIELRNTLKENSENAEARFLLGSINLKIGALTSAEKEFRRAMDAGWSLEAIQPELARIYINKKEFKKLLTEINAVDTWSADTRANIAGLRALAHANLKDMTNAKLTLDEGRTLSKNALQVLKTTAMLQLAGILPGEATSTLATARSLHPNNPEILLIHAANDIKNKKITRAETTYSTIIDLEPLQLVTANGRKARIGLARLQISNKNYEQANTTLAPLLKIKIKDPNVDYLAGLLSYSQGDFNRAEDHVHKLLAVLPDNVRAQQLMGKIQYAQKDYEQAALHLSKYLKASPDDINVRKLLTNTYLILNQPEQARKTLQQTLTANSTDASALTLLSQIEFKSGNMDAGITVLRKAIKSYPNNAQLHKLLAKAYIATGQTEPALSELNVYQQLSKDKGLTQKLTINAYIQAEQFEKALTIANNMLKTDKKNPDLLAMTGNLYANSGNNQQARRHFNTALGIQESHPAATLGLARFERKNGNFDQAISLYKGLINANIAGTVPMMELSEIAAYQKRNNDMLSWLEKARITAPTEIRARIKLAKYYLHNKQPQKAEIYIKEAIKQSPEQTKLIALQAKVLIALHRYSEAIPPLNKLVAKVPKSTTAHTLLGEAFLRQHMLGNARKQLKIALMIQKNNFIALGLLAETELKDGNLKKSLTHAKNLQHEQPEHFMGYMQEGDVWLAKQDYTRAQSAYTNAWQKQPSAQLAKKLYEASRPILSMGESTKPLLTWLKNNPNDTSTRFYLASKYQKEKQHEQAIKEYKKILLQTPDNSAALNNLAWLYSLNGNPEAMDLAERAYRFSPENPGIQDTYGWILVQQGQAKKGQRLIKQAMDIIPGNLDIRYHYATALIKSGNTAEGKQILEQLLHQDKAFDGREGAERLLKSL